MNWHRWLWNRVAIGLLLVSCAPRLPELQAIEAKQSELRNLLSTQGSQSAAFMTAALQLVRSIEAFAQKYPNHPRVPELLLEAAELEAVYFDDARRAVELLRRIDQRYRQKTPPRP